MKLYNSLTKKVEKFEALDGKTVRIYSCGPTVYDQVHIGNLSAFIYADTLSRTLRASGYEVRQVMNYTDVDDKTIRRSRELLPDESPEDALKKLAEKYIGVFQDDVKKIGIDTDNIEFMRATDNTAEMQKLIKKLYDGGFAYIANDGVYFSIEKYKASGKKYGQLVEISSANTSESRISNDEYDKDDAHDFALWKRQKPGEPVWDFELDGQDLKGRPGWHIECSAMSSKALGQPFDIHTGGVDLIFPHHENEIAQSTAGVHNPLLARFFVHNEHILVDGKKMSKSLNNFLTLKDIVGKDYDPLAFRLLVLQSHYRSQAHFSWENLDAAQNRLENWRSIADLHWQLPPASEPLDVLESLENDLDVPGALVAIDSYLETCQSQHRAPSGSSLALINQMLGINLAAAGDISTSQKQIIAARETARRKKDWSKSDELRNGLAEQGIGLNDTPHGAIWYRL